MKLRYKISLVVAVSIPIWFFVASWQAMRQMDRGYEIEPADEFPYLEAIFREDLGYDGLRENWIESCWANGFREHTQLYKLKLPQSELLVIKERFGSGERAMSSFDHLLDADYIGASTAPDWWDTQRLDRLPHLFHAGDERDWRLTDTGGVQYLLVLDL